MAVHFKAFVGLLVIGSCLSLITFLSVCGDQTRAGTAIDGEGKRNGRGIGKAGVARGWDGISHGEHRTLQVCSVHSGHSKWLPIQMRHLATAISGQVAYHVVTEIDPSKLWRSWRSHDFNGTLHSYNRESLFTKVAQDGRYAKCIMDKKESCDHAKQIDTLATFACKEAHPEDVLMFLDSDAWPVIKMQSLWPLLNSTPFVAVQRLENAGDLFPHPSFALTTCGFWTHHRLNWGAYASDSSRLPKGQSVPLDSGALLFTLFKEWGTPWLPLTRSNCVNLDPVFYALYGAVDGQPIVYHHGAGTRKVKQKSKISRGLGQDLEESQKLRLTEGSQMKLRRRHNLVFEVAMNLQKQMNYLAETLVDVHTLFMGMDVGKKSVGFAPTQHVNIVLGQLREGCWRLRFLLPAHDNEHAPMCNVSLPLLQKTGDNPCI